MCSYDFQLTSGFRMKCCMNCFHFIAVLMWVLKPRTHLHVELTQLPRPSRMHDASLPTLDKRHERGIGNPFGTWYSHFFVGIQRRILESTEQACRILPILGKAFRLRSPIIRLRVVWQIGICLPKYTTLRGSHLSNYTVSSNYHNCGNYPASCLVFETQNAFFQMEPTQFGPIDRASSQSRDRDWLHLWGPS
jgi:hypothetical protein